MQAVVLPLRGVVLFPGTLRSFPVGRPTSVAAVERHVADGVPLVAVPQRDPDEEDPLTARIGGIATSAQVLRAGRLPDGSLRLLVEGLERVRIDGIKLDDGATVCTFREISHPREDSVHIAGLAKQVAARFEEYNAGSGVSAQDHAILAEAVDDPGRLADQVAGQIELSHLDRLALLEEPKVANRLSSLLDHLVKALAGQRVAGEVNAKVQAAMDASQREYHLREQLKIIRQELGDAQGSEAEADQFLEKVTKAGMPPEVEEEAKREVERLRRIHPDTAEYTIIRTWLETCCDIPWSAATKDTTDPRLAQKVLDEDHHGLVKVKERIVEYLAVRQLKPDHKGPILCFVGPPGVGKTSLGRSIARALGRNFGRIALGGVKDETEIRGHRRTYIGALPGRILRALIRAESRNPVLVLDEIDKVGADFRGDPASALLEVLDPEQNSAFVDHYLDVPVDLSQVLFIATANVIDTVPHALIDRFEVIELPGYTEEEKVAISEVFLLPRLMERHGLKPSHLEIAESALLQTIRDYTREAGLRELERQLAMVHRKVARRVVEGHQTKVKLTGKALARYLGPPKFFQELAERVDQPGVVIGLAWTATGGDILFVEATRMPSKTPSLKLTGSLGEVMKESAEAAMSFLRSHARELMLSDEIFEAAFHLHVPAGAIPKDGPSAGVTMLTALASLCTGRTVKPKLAMTGEITLRGKVLPIGGVKEKVLAARRAGVETIILPKRNETDLDDVPKELRRDLTFQFVDTAQGVLELALEPLPK